mmetsp:Transcript_23100/g.87362  ORF Transcript_23100/g.87362 Transcript_23100/m.87362 type:complete len:338 (+) Transcript_23100:1902-2915(+)
MASSAFTPRRGSSPRRLATSARKGLICVACRDRLHTSRPKATSAAAIACLALPRRTSSALMAASTASAPAASGLTPARRSSSGTSASDTAGGKASALASEMREASSPRRSASSLLASVASCWPPPAAAPEAAAAAPAVARAPSSQAGSAGHLAPRPEMRTASVSETRHLARVSTKLLSAGSKRWRWRTYRRLSSTTSALTSDGMEPSPLTGSRGERDCRERRFVTRETSRFSRHRCSDGAAPSSLATRTSAPSAGGSSSAWTRWGAAELPWTQASPGGTLLLVVAASLEPAWAPASAPASSSASTAAASSSESGTASQVRDLSSSTSVSTGSSQARS